MLLDSDSMDIRFSPQVLRALKILQTHFFNETSIMKLNQLFMPVARKFVPSITEKQLNPIIDEYLLANGFFLAVDQLFFVDFPKNSSYTQMLYPSTCSREFVSKPTISLDAFLASGEGGERQCYFHFIKILRECANILTPGFIRLSTALESGSSYDAVDCFPTDWQSQIPPTIGPQIFSKRFVGDAGNAFEDTVFGGRVIIDSVNSRKPFKSYLLLKTLQFDDLLYI
jgi:hypothetical protein